MFLGTTTNFLFICVKNCAPSTNRFLVFPTTRLVGASNVRAADSYKSTHSNTESRRFKTTTNTTNKDENRLNDTSTKSAYVHPLSQIILEHLQQSRSDWVSQVGLDKGGLTLHKDGTFVLKFPTSGEGDTSGAASSTDKIW